MYNSFCTGPALAMCVPHVHYSRYWSYSNQCPHIVHLYVLHVVGLKILIRTAFATRMTSVHPRAKP